jgi:hypothetical protein
MGALPPARQTVPVTETAIGPDIHEALDIDRHFTAQRTLDLELVLYDIPYLDGLILGEIPRLHAERHIGLLKNSPGAGTPYSEDIGQSDLDVLVVGNIDSDYSRHRYAPFALPDIAFLLPLTLLVLGILAYDTQYTLALYDLAVGANLLYRTSNLHIPSFLSAALRSAPDTKGCRRAVPGTPPDIFNHL